MKQYGISEEEYLRMCDEQEGLCAICKNPSPRLCVDHNHKTNVVRQLLCFGCNVTLGHVKESVQTLLLMVSYLEKHSVEITS